MKKPIQFESIARPASSVCFLALAFVIQWAALPTVSAQESPTIKPATLPDEDPVPAGKLIEAPTAKKGNPKKAEPAKSEPKSKPRQQPAKEQSKSKLIEAPKPVESPKAEPKPKAKPKPEPKPKTDPPVVPKQDSNSLTASGIVFSDLDGDGRFGETDAVFAGVKVSNGKDIVMTDSNGRYSLPIEEGGTVFVLKPNGFRSPLSKDNLPKFYYLHKPNGSPKLKFPGSKPSGPLPKSIDFPLYEQNEPEAFKILLFGCLLYTSPSPRDRTRSRMPSSA